MNKFYFIKDIYGEHLCALQGNEKNGWTYYRLFYRLPSMYRYNRATLKQTVVTYPWRKCDGEEISQVFYPSISLFLGSHKTDYVEEISGEELMTKIILDNL